LNTQEKKLEKILTKDSVLYIIPGYQRAYSWSTDDAEKLMEDTLLVFREDKDSDFYLGSLICIEKESEIYEVVDGQQRLITLTILLSALDLLLEKYKNEIENNRKRLKNDLRGRITDYENVDDIFPKIKVRKKDYDFYSKEIMFCSKGSHKCIVDFTAKEIRSLPYSQRNMANNFNKLYKYLEEILLENDVNYLLDYFNYLLKKVSFIQITTDDINSSFRLFNVLNSRGMPLTYSDLFKSLLLEKINEKEKNKLIEAENKWDNIEDDIGLENMNSFLLAHCIAFKDKNELHNNKVLNSYKKLMEDKSNEFYNSPYKMLVQIENSYKIYMRIKNLDFKNGKLKKIIYALNNSNIKGSTPRWLPIVFCFICNMQKRSWQEKDLEYFMNNFEKVYYKMLFNKTRPGEIDAIISDIIIFINCQKGNIDEVINLLYEKTKKYNDISYEFLNSLSFGNKSTLILWKAFLVRLEMEFIEENIVPDFNSITIEHILPQKMDQYWKNIFSKDEHSEFVNNIGNIALLKSERNSSAKNLSFEIKKEKYKEYSKNKSIFALTESISLYEKWDKNSIIKRGKEILDYINLFLGTKI